MNTIENAITADSLNHEVIATAHKKAAPNNHKKWLMVTLTAAALTLSACSKQEEEKPMESSVHEFDAQTSEEEAAAEIAESNAPMISDREDSPVLPSSDEPAGTGAITGAGAEPDKDITGGVGSTVNSEVLNDESAVDPNRSEVSNDNQLESNETAY
ncbi:hypothetical protein [Psychrobacter jeotgali]|uniref:hypothetical protein n=1 Tax=Psychrobacter jeotgali TaxID=179010 RepID=UPI00191964E8|nr:hypothetical protein [Psychrobacter jeotgali]